MDTTRFELRLKHLRDKYPEDGRFWSDNNGLERMIGWLTLGMNSEGGGPVEILCRRYAKPAPFEPYAEAPAGLVVVMGWEKGDALTAAPCVWRCEEHEGRVYGRAGLILPDLPETATDFERFSRDGGFYSDGEKKYLARGWTLYENRIRRLCETAWRRAENLDAWLEHGEMASVVRKPPEGPKNGFIGAL